MGAIGVIFPSLHETQLGARCSEKGCPWPPECGGKCYAHRRDQNSWDGSKRTSSSGWTLTSTVTMMDLHGAVIYSKDNSGEV